MAPEEREPVVAEETYAGDYRASQEAAADAEGGAGLGGAVRRVIADLQAEAASEVYAEGQARRLELGVETRGGPRMPGTYYLGYGHPALKDMVETNMDPAQVNDTGAAWNSLGNTLVEFQEAVSTAVEGSAEDWSGVAGDSARGYFAGVGDWMGGTGQAFQLAANRLNAQSEAAASARAGMPEPVDFSMNDAIGMLERETNIFNLHNTISQVNQKFAEKQQAHELAAEVMTNFAKAMGESGSGMPTFAPVPNMGEPAGNAGGESVDDRPVGGRGTGSWPAGGGGPAVDVSAGGGVEGGMPPASDGAEGDAPRPGGGGLEGPGGGVGSDPGSTPVQSGQVSVPGGLGGGDHGVRPVAGGPGGEPAGGLPIGGFPGGRPGSGAGPVGGRGFGPDGRPGTGGEASGRLGAGGEPGARGFGGRSGAGGGPLAGEPGAGGRSGAGGEHGSGGRGGAGALGAGQATGRGAGPGRGGASGMGMGPMGAGGFGQGEQDVEHRRPSWLEEPDPEGLFGSDETTAPPVIGES
jgi:hypothetical protein